MWADREAAFSKLMLSTCAQKDRRRRALLANAASDSYRLGGCLLDMVELFCEHGVVGGHEEAVTLLANKQRKQALRPCSRFS
jgi:hypothetical protein